MYWLYVVYLLAATQQESVVIWPEKIIMLALFGVHLIKL